MAAVFKAKLGGNFSIGLKVKFSKKNKTGCPAKKWVKRKLFESFKITA